MVYGHLKGLSALDSRHKSLYDIRMIRHFTHSFRLLCIFWVLARYDALFFLEASRGRFLIALMKPIRRRNLPKSKGGRLGAALQALGPSYIKLGQALSTRSDMVGEDMAADLAGLRDRLPPFDAARARRIVEESFDKKLPELFSSFEQQSAAAASIAQVHFAELHDGRDVAVKILRPGIHRAFSRDLRLFYWIAGRVEWAVPAWRRLHLSEMVAVFEQTVAMELDLRFEAAAAEECAGNMKDDSGIFIPKIEWNLTSQRVLTMERIRGIPMHDVMALKEQGHDPQALLQRAAESFFNQVFRDGFFHADLHPGNLFVLPDGRIALLDFGITGRLDWRDRIFLAEVLRGFLGKDFTRVAEVHFERGIVPAHKSKQQFAQACHAIAGPILDKPLNEISVARLLAQLFRVSEAFEMELQPQFLLLQKTMMLAEGVGRMLCPDANMWQLAEPMIAEWGRSHLGRRALVRQATRDMRTHLARLPVMLEHADAVLTRMATEPVEKPRRIPVIYVWGVVLLALAAFWPG